MIFSDRFQQSQRFELNVPQIQFFLRVPDIPVATQRHVPTVHTFTVQVQFLELSCNDRCVVETVQKTLEVRQLPLIDKIVDVVVIMQRQAVHVEVMKVSPSTGFSRVLRHGSS